MDAKASGETKQGRLTFNRADYLAIKVTLGAAVIGAVVVGLVAPMRDAVTNAPLPVSYTTKVTSGFELPRGATHDGFATMQLELRDATLGERLIQALPGLLFATMTIAVAALLLQLILSTQAGEPFTRRNVRRINSIALVVGIGGMLTQYAGGFADNALQTTNRLPDLAGPSFEVWFSPWPLVVMLILSFIGEAFRRGVELRDDVEGLV